MNEKMFFLIITAIFCLAPYKNGTTLLSLEITIKNGIITGYVRNSTNHAVRINARHHFGHWERTSLFYHHGAWQKANLKSINRPHFGHLPDPIEIELSPGKVLGPPVPELPSLGSRKTNQIHHTFQLSLADYILPSDLKSGSKFRVETCGLISNEIELKE